jgi:hypothetical protein
MKKVHFNSMSIWLSDACRIKAALCEMQGWLGGPERGGNLFPRVCSCMYNISNFFILKYLLSLTFISTLIIYFIKKLKL